jgi:putative restriction endonuclease
MGALLDQTIERLYALNVGVIGTDALRHERPHKPLLLLAVLDLLDTGLATPDCIEWNAALRERFSAYFEKVKKADDRDTPENPFHYLASEGFWQVFRRTPAGPAPQETTPLVRDSGQLFARLVDGMDHVFADAANRHRLRHALVARYFPAQASVLFTAPVVREELLPYDAEAEPEAPGRSAGFRKKVAEVYDHQCAACGLRLRLPGSDIALVDAAHLIPFAVSFNDHPSNGLALCKNHHWAMDRSLIAPHPEGRWVVSRVLISHRSSGEAELAKLQDKPLLPPADEAFCPAVNAMRWRVERLAA